MATEVASISSILIGPVGGPGLSIKEKARQLILSSNQNWVIEHQQQLACTCVTCPYPE